MPHYQSPMVLPNGESKTRLIWELGLDGASHPLVRATATGLVRGAPRFDHIERVTRLHRFVRDSVPYHREPIEMLHPAAFVLMNGGDCDDHAILMVALAWAVKYPAIVEAINPENPSHYTMRVGTPPAETPFGDARTRWWSVETTVPAAFGEHVSAVVPRLGGLS